MGAGNKVSLKEMGRLLRILFTTARIDNSLFRRLALAACAVRFILYAAMQTVVLIGSPTHTRLSIDSDLLCVAIALAAMCRARDAGTRGLYGFLGGIVSIYGVAILLIVGIRAAGIPFDVSSVRVVAIVPQVTQLLFVCWMLRWPSVPTSQPGTA